jgi:hypothetical protein
MTAPTPDQAQAPVGPDCPECGTWAEFLVGDNQAFCGNDDCRILMWDPTMTRAEMAAEGVHEIDLRDGGWSSRDMAAEDGDHDDCEPTL